MAIWRESTSSTARSKTASLSLVLKSTWRLLSVLVTDLLVVNSMAPSLVNVALARPIDKGVEHQGFVRQQV